MRVGQVKEEDGGREEQARKLADSGVVCSAIPPHTYHVKLLSSQNQITSRFPCGTL